MINNKFKYQEMTRETIDSQRLYNTPNGERLPSVTTILDRTKPAADKEALENWRKAVGHAKAKQVTEEAAARGTRMHNYLEHYVLTGSHKAPPRNPFAIPSHRMAQEVIDKGLCNMTAYWGVEVALYFSGLYAGTTDGVGEWKGIPAIFDYKQTNKAKTVDRVIDYKIQLAAYAAAHNNMFGTDIKHGIIMMCIKPDEKIVTSVPVYQEFVVEAEEFAFYTEKWWDRVDLYYSTI